MGSIFKNSLIILRRLCSSAREAPAVNKEKMMIVEETTAIVRINGGDTNKVYWMKDPNTGNWMPENHFGDLDVAELRKKLISKTTKI